MLASDVAGTQMPVVDVAASAAFADLFESQRRRALRLAYLLTGDRDLAEEVAAEVFVRLYPKWQQGKIDDPGAYVRRAVINHVNSTFRRIEVRRRHDRPNVPHLAAAADAGVEDRDAVQRALLVLPVRQRAAIALRYLDDLSEAETADALGISVGTVKSQVSRGLDRLRELLDANKEGDAR
jgi:RNA polymerase sigma-70 factor (sigma-E family)